MTLMHVFVMGRLMCLRWVSNVVAATSSEIVANGSEDTTEVLLHASIGEPIVDYVVMSEFTMALVVDAVMSEPIAAGIVDALTEQCTAMLVVSSILCEGEGAMVVIRLLISTVQDDNADGPNFDELVMARRW